MQRYFLEVSYKGTRYSGFQVQQNANTVQAEVEKAFFILQREKVEMTGSSRTDAGVHARQNFFHFDYNGDIHAQFLYKINSILPPDIVVQRCMPVHGESHCRFDAISREYHYHIYGHKDPFSEGRAFYFPYRLNRARMEEAAAVVPEYQDFTSFSKRNTQVKSFHCHIKKSQWVMEDHRLLYQVSANRFLRGMVRALVATMLQVGRNKISVREFRQVIESRNCTLANFAVPAHGLYLISVQYPENIYQ